MSEEYMMSVVMGEDYERITNIAGVKTTVCKNRFEIVCQNRGEVNEAVAVAELRAWINKRRQEEMRESRDMPKAVS